MRTLIIDGEEISDIVGLHQKIAEELDLPDYYGSNLDALYDCLGDLNEEVEIRIVNSDVLVEALGEEYVEALEGVINDVGEEYGKVRVEIA